MGPYISKTIRLNFSRRINQERPGNANPLIFKDVQKRLQGARKNPGIRIEEKDNIALRPAKAGIVRPSETDVLARFKNLDGKPAPNISNSPIEWFFVIVDNYNLRAKNGGQVFRDRKKALLKIVPASEINNLDRKFHGFKQWVQIPSARRLFC